MRKKIFGRQLKRDKNERKALFKSLLSSLILYESIQTTEAKAKSIKSSADKLITKAKKGGLHSFRLVSPDISSQAVKKLLNIIAPRFASRQGGYTRIIRTGKRLKDNAQEVIIQWTEMAKMQQKQVAVVNPPQMQEEPKDIDKKSEKKVKLDKKTKETKDKKTTKEKTK
jgi:large subunit ribosomal protein L17